MLLIVTERFWGIDPRKPEYFEKLSDFKIVRFKKGRVIKFRRKTSYKFVVTKTGRNTGVIRLLTGKGKVGEKIPLKRFVPMLYRPFSFDAGYSYCFILI